MLVGCTIDDAIHELAARQHGALAILQASELGVTRAMLRHRVAHGRLAAAHEARARRSRVHRPTISHRLMVAVLDAGPDAFLSHRASAALWKTSGFGLARLRLDRRDETPSARPDARARSRGCTRCSTSEPDHVTVLDGIPVADAHSHRVRAGRFSPPAVAAERALDSMWARNLTSRSLLDQMFDDWADRGRAGTVLMRELLEARPFGYVPPREQPRGPLRDPRRALLRRAVPAPGRSRRTGLDRPCGLPPRALPARGRGPERALPRRTRRSGGRRPTLRPADGSRVRRRARMGPRAVG